MTEVKTSANDRRDADEYDERHAQEWMERHPHGWYNSESDYGTGDEADEAERMSKYVR